MEAVSGSRTERSTMLVLKIEMESHLRPVTEGILAFRQGGAHVVALFRARGSDLTMVAALP
jgi:hypothetical protein